jgi:imidazolonepropionase-like amidohydrolase
MRGATLVLLALALTATVAVGEPLVIRGARVIVAPGKVVDPALIVVDGGKVKAIGADAKEPPMARILDASGLTILPGFVCAATTMGLSGSRITRPSNEVRVRRIDDVDPLDGVWESARRAGVTTLALVPQALGVGGLGAIVKPKVGTRKTMTVRADAPLVLGIRSDTSSISAFRGGLEKAKQWIAAEEAHRKAVEERAKVAKEKAAKAKAEAAKKPPAPTKAPAPAAKPPVVKPEPPLPPKPAEDPKIMPFVRALRGEIPCVVRVARSGGTGGSSASLVRLLAILKDSSLKPLVVIDGYTAVLRKTELKASGLTVMISPSYASDPRTVGWLNPARHMHEAGIPFVLAPFSSPGELRHRLALLVKSGLPRKVALTAVTVHPARVLGMEKRVGTIRPGGDADLVFFDGDPLDPLTRVVRVMIDGATVYERSEDKR